jgi:hypothetical protein
VCDPDPRFVGILFVGIVNRITEPGDALQEAIALEESLLKDGPSALAAIKRII